MDRTANIGRELIGLDRIVAVLFVLAHLAEDAAASYYPVRCAMLWGLRMADARVKEFAGRYGYWMGLPPRPAMEAFDGSDRDAALSLALSFRGLASVIADMIARLRRRQFLFGRRAASADLLDRRRPLLVGSSSRSPVSFAGSPDTS